MMFAHFNDGTPDVIGPPTSLNPTDQMIAAGVPAATSPGQAAATITNQTITANVPAAGTVLTTTPATTVPFYKKGTFWGVIGGLAFGAGIALAVHGSRK